MDRKLLAITSSILTFTVFVWWITSSIELPEQLTDAAGKSVPDYEIDGLQLVRMDKKGNKKFSLTAKRMTHYPGEGWARLENTYLVQYLRDGVTIHTRADKANYPDSGKEILMQHNVRIIRKKNGLVQSDIRSDSTRIILQSSGN